MNEDDIKTPERRSGYTEILVTLGELKTVIRHMTERSQEDRELDRELEGRVKSLETSVIGYVRWVLGASAALILVSGIVIYVFFSTIDLRFQAAMTVFLSSPQFNEKLQSALSAALEERAYVNK